MKLFKVAAQTPGYLLEVGDVLEDGEQLPTLKKWSVRNDTTFTREQLEVCPVNVDRVYPKGSASMEYYLAKRGMAVFTPPREKRDAWKDHARTIAKWRLVVAYKSVEVS